MAARVLRKIPSFVIFSFILILNSSGTMAQPLTKEHVFQMATAAAREGAYQAAVDLYKRVLDMDPRFAPAYNNLGLVYQSWNDGNINEAIRYFRLATEMAPNYIEAWNSLGRATYNQGDFSSARTAFLHSLEQNANQPDIHLALAWVYLLGESDAEPAIQHFQDAIAVVDNDMAHYGLGLAYLLSGDRFKILDEITELRKRQRNPEASALEKMFRDKARISSTKGQPLVTGRDPGGSVFDREMVALSGRSGKSDNVKKGIQVRLTEPLW